MRLRLRKTLQVIVVCACVLVYINFFLASKSALSGLGLTLGTGQAVKVIRDEQSAKLDLTLSRALTNRTNFNSSLASSEKQGTRYKLENQTVIYPSEEHYSDDRILNQLKYVPEPIIHKIETGNGNIQPKKIILYNGFGGWAVKRGDKTFKEQQCSVPYCELTDARASMSDADVVIFQGVPKNTLPRPANQIWGLYLLESPYHTPNLVPAAGLINWTATYRHDSTLVAPYEKFVPFNSSVLTKVQTKNYAEGKTKKVAWFVSNCGARNRRKQYADELSKYIEVDIYGHCGKLKCPRFQSSKCFDMLNKDYKFYLSFENSNCRDYITEKFFVNGLKHDVIPIVMGAAPEDYRRAAPFHSFIHVDDFDSPQELAQYLHKLDQDDTLYNEYFQWKGTGDIINTYFWCRVCALAHDKTRGSSWYDDINAWWRGERVCIGQENWRIKKPSQKLIADMPFVIDKEH